MTSDRRRASGDRAGFTALVHGPEPFSVSGVAMAELLHPITVVMRSYNDARLLPIPQPWTPRRV